jgi:DNA-binding transcriptional MerR regulator
MLCPNCHAQTDSYCGKGGNKHHKRKEKVKRYSKKKDPEFIKKVLHLWEKGFLVKEIAKECDISQKTASIILKQNGVTLEEIRNRSNKVLGSSSKRLFSKKIQMIDINSLEVVKEFNSIKESAEYILKNSQYTSTLNTVRKRIFHVNGNKKKSAYGYKWKFVE